MYFIYSHIVVYMNVFHISDLFYYISGFLDEKSLFTLEITNKYFNDSVKDMTWIWDKNLLNRTGGYSVLRPSINPYTYIKKINRSKHNYCMCCDKILDSLFIRCFIKFHFDEIIVEKYHISCLEGHKLNFQHLFDDPFTYDINCSYIISNI